MASIGSTATDSEPVHWVEGDGLSIVSKPWCEKTPVCSSELDRYKSKYLGPSDRSKIGSEWGIKFCSSRSYPTFTLEKSNSFSTDRLGYCHRDDGSGKRVLYSSKVGIHQLAKDNGELNVKSCNLHGTTPEVKVVRHSSKMDCSKSYGLFGKMKRPQSKRSQIRTCLVCI